MGKTRGPYNAEFPAGTWVQVVDRLALEQFCAEWKWHNPLTPDQLVHAGKTVQVKSVGYYHGADELYVLEGIPGVWHEQNLQATANGDV